MVIRKMYAGGSKLFPDIVVRPKGKKEALAVHRLMLEPEFPYCHCDSDALVLHRIGHGGLSSR